MKYGKSKSTLVNKKKTLVNITHSDNERKWFVYIKHQEGFFHFNVAHFIVIGCKVFERVIPSVTNSLKNAFFFIIILISSK